MNMSSPESGPDRQVAFGQKAGAPVQNRGAKGRPPQSVSMTDQNAPGAVLAVCGDVVAAVVGGGVGSAISVSCSRGIRPIPVAMAIAVTISDVAIGAVGRGATLDAAKIGLAATLETMQSASTIQMRRTTSEVARRCARGDTVRKAGDRSGRRTTEGRTATA